MVAGVKRKIGVFACKISSRSFVIASLFYSTLSAASQWPYFQEDRQSYSLSADQSYPTNVYWGDTHLHTNLSWDAYNFGNVILGPEQAYRFAKGEAVTAHNGMVARLSRPLDFLVIADHASNMGVMNGLARAEESVLKTYLGKRWNAKLRDINDKKTIDPQESKKLSKELFLGGLMEGEVVDVQYRETVWNKVAAVADRHNDPGRFTAFIGYEWTQLYYMLHRVVIFKDNAQKATQVIPFSQYDSNDPEDLWVYLQSYENNTGGEVLAIPHNSNLSSGTMFALEDAKGNPLSGDYAKARSRWEPLFEVTQIKGDSETHPLLSANDQFADYETWTQDIPIYYNPEVAKRRGYSDYQSWLTKINRNENSLWARKFEYARSALKFGLQQQATIKVNPFKFGMVGSTDAHTSLSTGDEDNFWGKFSLFEPNDKRVKSLLAGNVINRSFSAAGYAAVWAKENTRDSLFAAMKRKEVYATTGPRILVRFFGGWDYQTDDAFKPDLAHIGYSKGVPMGGDLAQAPDKYSPSFLIRAVKDPDGANLDRVQVIKGWQSQDGELHEKIYNVALSDGRKDKGHKTRPVGNTVDIADASYINTIGDAELAVVWTDPEFNSAELAFYYLRVLEIPTPRWTAYDAKYFKLKDIPDEVPMITQERAYSSPIWYSPPVRQEAVMSTVKQENN